MQPLYFNTSYLYIRTDTKRPGSKFEDTIAVSHDLFRMCKNRDIRTFEVRLRDCSGRLGLVTWREIQRTNHKPN